MQKESISFRGSNRRVKTDYKASGSDSQWFIKRDNWSLEEIKRNIKPYERISEVIWKGGVR